MKQIQDIFLLVLPKFYKPLNANSYLLIRLMAGMWKQ